MPETTPEPLLDPDCRDGKCGSCVGGPCEHHCHRAEAVCTDAPGCPCGCVSDVQAALSTLDDLTADFGSLPAEDIDALDAWANNIQLDIMRHRRLQGAPRG